MFEKAKKLFIIPMIAFVGMASLAFVSPVTVHAQEQTNALCTVFPFLNSIGIFGINTALCGGGSTEEAAKNAATSTIAVLKLATSLIFIGIIIIAVFIIIKAAIKYIRSEGDEAKVQEAQKAIKTVFIGIAALFIGILGVVLVLAFFQVTNTESTTGVDNANLPSFLQVFIDAFTGGGQ